MVCTLIWFGPPREEFCARRARTSALILASAEHSPDPHLPNDAHPAKTAASMTQSTVEGHPGIRVLLMNLIDLTLAIHDIEKMGAGNCSAKSPDPTAPAPQVGDDQATQPPMPRGLCRATRFANRPVPRAPEALVEYPAQAKVYGFARPENPGPDRANRTRHDGRNLCVAKAVDFTQDDCHTLLLAAGSDGSIHGAANLIRQRQFLRRIQIFQLR